MQPEPWMPLKRPPTKKEVWRWCQHHFQTVFDTGELIGLAQRMWAWAYTHWVNTSGWDRPPDWELGDPVCAWALPGNRIDEDDYEEAVCSLYLKQRQYVAERTAA